MAEKISQAFLLAAGLGTRLRPLTNTMPKCLLPIGGKPLLQIWLENLKRHGINKILINTHWFADKVSAFLTAQSNAYFQLNIFNETNLLGSAGTIWANKEWVGKKPFFILYGDNLTNVNLSKMIAFHQEHGLPFTLGVFQTDNPRQCGIAEIDEGGNVVGFEEKPKEPKSHWAAAGIYLADHRIFQALPEMENKSLASRSVPFDMGFHVIPKLLGQMKAYFIHDFLMDIGTPQSYEQAQQSWKEME